MKRSALRVVRTAGMALAAGVMAASLCAAQEEPAGEFEGLVEVSEVLLDVLATDRKGDVVRGLGGDDFVVKENGKPVELTGVSFYTTRYGEADSGEGAAEEIPASRYFIFFFHNQRLFDTSLGSRHQQRHEAARAAHDWVRDEMYPSDWVAVVSHRYRLFVLQDFTQDRESLMAAVSAAAGVRKPEEPTPSQWKRLVAQSSPFSLRRGLPGPTELKRKTRRIYEAIGLVAEATRPIVGRKNLLLYTVGFGDFDSTTLTSRPDHRFYPAMEHALNDNNVAVYPMDLTHPEVTHSQESFLNRLALASGGLYYRTLTSFKTRLERIAAENSGYYLLSFRATHPAGESGYRAISVKAKDSRIRIRARRGYRYGL